MDNFTAEKHSVQDINENVPGVMLTIRGGFRGGRTWRAPPFCKDTCRVPDFAWAPQAKRMHHIVWIDFENYNFSSLLRGHIPLRHHLSQQALKFCQSLIWAPPLLKSPGSALGNHNYAYTGKGNCNVQICFVHQNGLTVSTKILNLHLWCDGSSNETENFNFEK